MNSALNVMDFVLKVVNFVSPDAEAEVVAMERVQHILSPILSASLQVSRPCLLSQLRAIG